MVGFYTQEYYQRNKEKIKERNNKYYQLHREERLLYQHDYNMLTEVERKQKNKQRYWAVRDKNTAKAKPPPADYPVAYVPASFSISFA
jgi:hypothetical protein